MAKLWRRFTCCYKPITRSYRIREVRGGCPEGRPLTWHAKYDLELTTWRKEAKGKASSKRLCGKSVFSPPLFLCFLFFLTLSYHPMVAGWLPQLLTLNTHLSGGGEREEKGENISFVCPFYQKWKSFPEALPHPQQASLVFHCQNEILIFRPVAHREEWGQHDWFKSRELFLLFQGQIWVFWAEMLLLQGCC